MKYIKSHWLFLWFALILLTGCSTYHQNNNQLPIQYLKQSQQNYATVPDGQIEYYQFGMGTPIVLIAGYATDVTSWDVDFLAALAKHHRVIVFNNRNVGRSQIASNKYSSQDLADDTYHLIQDLHLYKPAVIGISMGGMIAQQLAVLHPQTLGQLILINTAIAGKQAVHPSPDVEKTLLNMPTSKLGRYKIAVDYFFPPEWKTRMAYALAVDRFQPDHYIDADPAPTMEQQRQLVMNWVNNNSAAQKIRKLKLPVLILNGEADIVIPPINSVILHNNIKHSKLVRWPDGGHAMIYQFPDQMADIINNFIAKS